MSDASKTDIQHLTSDIFFMMTCEETQQAFSLFVDDRLALPARARLERHLQQCPLCRARLTEWRSLVQDLGSMARPVPPPTLVSSITSALRIEAAARPAQPGFSLPERVIEWLQPRLMPYTVGAFASLLFFMVMFAGLRSSLMAFHDWDLAARQAQTAAAFRVLSDEGFDITRPIPAAIFAAERAEFSGDSPSLNPRGALAAFTRSPLQNHEDDDDMVVVTDVFSNGIASLASVMQPPRNPRMLDEFQDALRKTPAFVPASLDRRPQTMRVVFVIQKVDVRERQF